MQQILSARMGTGGVGAVIGAGVGEGGGGGGEGAGGGRAGGGADLCIRRKLEAKQHCASHCQLYLHDATLNLMEGSLASFEAKSIRCIKIVWTVY